MIYRVYNDQYIAAIIEGTFELSQWLISVPKERLDGLRVEGCGPAKYPMTILEYELLKKRLFLYVLGDVGATKNAVGGTGMKLLCTYTIHKDFRGDPKNPGLDYMGILDHEHEDEDEIPD